MLVVEDDPAVAEAVGRGLAEEGFAVWLAGTGRQAMELWRSLDPDAVLLDLNLPDMDGLDVCSGIRAADVVPMIIASGRTAETDRVCGLELGADDYVCKPFEVREVAARLRALLRRTRRYRGLGPSDGDVVAVGGLRLDRTCHGVTAGGREIELTPKEFDLLWALAEEAGRTVPSRRLLWDVWGYDEHIRTRTLDVHVGRLRRKLEEEPARPRLIVTVPSVGYRLQTGAAEALRDAA